MMGLDMTKEELKKYREKLEKEKARFLKEAGAQSQPEDFGDDTDHSDEESDEAEELGNRLAISQVFKDRINNIDLALNKIKTGKYGICEQCQGEIFGKVLSIVPASRFCQKCKIKNTLKKIGDKFKITRA